MKRERTEGAGNARALPLRASELRELLAECSRWGVTVLEVHQSNGTSVRVELFGAVPPHMRLSPLPADVVPIRAPEPVPAVVQAPVVAEGPRMPTHEDNLAAGTGYTAEELFASADG